MSLEMPPISNHSALAPEATVKRLAFDAGFDLCGITSHKPIVTHERYKAWLENGYAGQMDYLHRHEPLKADPALLMDDTKSIVCVGINYSVENGRSSIPNGDEPQIARYARWDDYHASVWRQLNALLESIREIFPDAKGRVFCDSAPVSERALATRAGIGWIGKHTNLISKTYGCWFFLGELFLNIELAPDSPHPSHCGSCSKCIPACPTGAIVAPYELDARRCISYLTIELKGSIPEELRPLMGARIYGCDDCLAVCPWNKFAKKANEAILISRQDLDAPQLVELLSLTDDQFRALFRNSPILRTKRRGFLRNICVALGNTAGPEALPMLYNVIGKETDSIILEHAQWAVMKIETKDHLS
jgi:epoxyqueuosine reductase